MMSLSTANLLEIVKKQYTYKLKAHSGVFTTLVVIQLLGLLFSLTGVSSFGSGSENHSLSVTYYSADIVIVFTMLWAFSSAILVTTKAYRNDDFAFVANRLSSNLSNILFLVAASLMGGMTALLSRFLLAVFLYYVLGLQFSEGSHFFATAGELVMGFVATCLYILLFSALGYLAGMLVQVSKLFVVLLPAAFIGNLILGARMGSNEGNAVFEFIFSESSYILFLVKVIVTFGLSFLIAGAVFNRLEVRQ